MDGITAVLLIFSLIPTGVLTCECDPNRLPVMKLLYKVCVPFAGIVEVTDKESSPERNYTHRHIKLARLKLSTAPMFPLHHNDKASSGCLL